MLRQYLFSGDMRKWILLGFFLFLFLVSSVLVIKVNAQKYNFFCSYESKKQEMKCFLKEVPFGEMRKRIQIFGTEYGPEQPGTVYLLLLDSGQPVNDARCDLTIYNPDKTYWIEEATMLFLEKGLYYYDIYTPEDSGVYMLNVFCFYKIDEVKEHADAFQLQYGESVSGTFEDTYSIDGVTHSLSESISGKKLQAEYNFNNIVPPENFTSIDITFYGKWDDDEEDVKVYVWNYNVSGWEVMPNKISYSPTFVTISNSIKENFDSYLQNGTVKLKLEDNLDVGQPFGTLDVDLLEVSIPYIAEAPVAEIRGGGEVHVSYPPVNVVIPELGNITVAEWQGKEVWRMFLMRGTPPFMPSTEYYCKDNVTLVKNITFEYCEQKVPKPAECYVISKVEEKVCPYGCDMDECNPSPTWRILIVIGIIIFIIFIIYLFKRWW